MKTSVAGCPPVILAFLQNMWVRDPERVKRDIAKHGEELRLRYIEYALFAGCKTGRNLKKAFGQELIDKIIWEETTREIAGDAKTIFPADLEHITKCFDVHKPEIVVTFGKIAEDSVSRAWCNLELRPIHLRAHHPASRNPASYQTLADVAEKLKEYVG